MSTRSKLIGIVTSGWIAIVAVGSVFGQWTQGGAVERSSASAQSSDQGNWVPRFTTPGAAPAALATRPPMRTESPTNASPVFSARAAQRGRAIQASYQVAQPSQDSDVFADGDQLEPIPPGEPVSPGEAIPSNEPVRSGGQPGCKSCNRGSVAEQFAADDDGGWEFENRFEGGGRCPMCDGPAGACCCDEDCFPLLRAIARRDLYFFGGAHGFKGPADLGRNGNFGFQEGFNFGAPLGDPWGWGYQIGFGAAQSDFSGYRDETLDQARRGSRNQQFITVGLFKRVTQGVQWGVVFDWQHDQYYQSADLKQVRSETGWVFANGTEIGYFGAYRAGGDTVQTARTNIFLAPTDMFAGFARRYFQTGAEGRIWGGATGMGDGLIGADFRVPLGGSLALENRFNYLLPKQGRGVGGQTRESWGLVMQITWYPGKKATCMNQREFLPLINVADNATFMQQLQVAR